MYLPGAAPGDATGPDAESLLVPTAPMLRQLAIQRALRPLKRRVRSRLDQMLDEDATAARIAQRMGERPWTPVLTPTRERWLSLAIVIDTGTAIPWPPAFPMANAGATW